VNIPTHSLFATSRDVAGERGGRVCGGPHFEDQQSTGWLEISYCIIYIPYFTVSPPNAPIITDQKVIFHNNTQHLVFANKCEHWDAEIFIKLY
jgi:hypothetical protein